MLHLVVNHRNRSAANCHTFRVEEEEEQQRVDVEYHNLDAKHEDVVHENKVEHKDMVLLENVIRIDANSDKEVHADLDKEVPRTATNENVLHIANIKVHLRADMILNLNPHVVVLNLNQHVDTNRSNWIPHNLNLHVDYADGLNLHADMNYVMATVVVNVDYFVVVNVDYVVVVNVDYVVAVEVLNVHADSNSDGKHYNVVAAGLNYGVPVEVSATSYC